MLDLERVKQLATETAAASFGKRNVSQVFVEPTVDSTGQEALRITLVFPGKSIPKNVNGEAVVKNLVRIHNVLEDNGDNRLPILHYATEDELQHSDDTES
jgi:hypothetical protein